MLLWGWPSATWVMMRLDDPGGVLYRAASVSYEKKFGSWPVAGGAVLWQPAIAHRMTTGLTMVANFCACMLLPASGPGPPAGTSPTSQAPRTTTSAIREDRRASIVANQYMQDSTPARGPRAAQKFPRVAPPRWRAQTPTEVGRPKALDAGWTTRRVVARRVVAERTSPGTRRRSPRGVGFRREREAAPDVHPAHRRPVRRAGHGDGAVPPLQVGLTVLRCDPRPTCARR